MKNVKTCIGYFEGYEGIDNVIPGADYILRIYSDPAINRVEIIKFFNESLNVEEDIRLENADYKSFWNNLKKALSKRNIRQVFLYDTNNIVDDELLDKFNDFSNISKYSNIFFVRSGEE